MGSLIISSLLVRLFIFYCLGFRNDPWTYRFFPSEIMFFLLGYISYQIYLRIRNKEIHKYISFCVLIFVFFFTLLYSNFPSNKAEYFPFSLKEFCYFSTIVFSVPLLFKFLKASKLDNQIGELSYPVYITHFLVAMVCGTLPFIFLKSGGAIAIITITASYLLNRIVALPIEKYRQSRLIKGDYSNTEYSKLVFKNIPT